MSGHGAWFSMVGALVIAAMFALMKCLLEKK